MNRIGFALCGSFCTFDQAILSMGLLKAQGNEVTPLMSEFAYSTDTRFGNAEEFVRRVEEACGRPVLHTIVQAEPVGPEKLFDIVVVAPCTGNTLAKLALGITDTCVTMAAKAHLRNQRPLLLAVSTNDALGNSAKNIGSLLNYRDVFFVPMRQDNPQGKPRSVVADFSVLPRALELALLRQQLQPLYQ